MLADKSLGKPDDPEVIRRKIEMISEVALNPTTARNFVENYKYSFDFDGNLYFNVANELRYSSRAAKKALEIFKESGFDYDNREDRSHIDLTFLTGYLTASGFLQKAKLATQSR